MVMDNAAMTWMFTNRHLKHKFARWIITLKEYTYHVRLSPGAINQLADALSRHPTGECSQSRRGDSWILFSQEDVSKAHRDDSDLATMIGVLSTSSGNPNFVLRNGMPYRRVWSKSRNEEHHVIAIPAALRAEILRAAHDSPRADTSASVQLSRKYRSSFGGRRCTAKFALM